MKSDVLSRQYLLQRSGYNITKIDYEDRKLKWKKSQATITAMFKFKYMQLFFFF